MAGDDEEGKRSRKRRSSPSPSRGEDGGRRKSRKRDEEEKKSRRREEKREKKEKSHKTHKSSRKRDEKDAEEVSREKNHKRSRKGSDSIEELTENDYFSKNNEFSTWLKEEKGLFFSDLSSTNARKLFSGFVKDWNKGKLKSGYYEGIARGTRTAHNWKIRPEK